MLLFTRFAEGRKAAKFEFYEIHNEKPSKLKEENEESDEEKSTPETL